MWLWCVKSTGKRNISQWPLSKSTHYHSNMCLGRMNNVYVCIMMRVYNVWVCMCVMWWWLVVVDTHTYMYSMIIHKWLDVIRPPWLPGGDRSPTLEGCVRHIPLECSHECVQPPTIRKMCHCVDTEIQSMYSEYGTSWKCQQVSWNLLCVLTLCYTSWKLG